jgi:hypothetical protein
MNELSAAHVGFITRDVRRKQITFSHLLDDLIDHICCDVEDEMQQGLTFEKAYHKVKNKIGIRGLNIIQEETLYAVDTKYKRMKNTMKISGIAGTVLLGFATIFKIMHWPWAGVMITLGTFLLVALFMPSSMMVLWKESKSKNRLFLFISGFFAGTLFIAGVLLKIQHWPGAGIVMSLAFITGGLLFLPVLLAVKLREEENKKKRLLYCSGFIALISYMLFIWFKMQHWPNFTLPVYILSVSLFLILIPWYVFQEWKDEAGVSTKFIFMVIAIVTVLLPSSMISLNLQQNYDTGFFYLTEQSQQIVDFQMKSNEKFLAGHHDSIAFDRMNRAHAQTSSILSRIDEIKLQLVEISGGPANIAHNSEGIPYRQLSNPFEHESVQLMLLPGCETRREIDTLFSAFIGEMKMQIGQQELPSEKSIPGMMTLLPGINDPPDKITLIAALHALNLTESAILQIESRVFKSLSQKSVENK